MTKTCYFCKRFGECDVYSDTQACSDDFKPNADWIEYEALKKENEELKRKIKSYQYEREKLHSYLAKRR